MGAPADAPEYRRIAGSPGGLGRQMAESTVTTQRPAWVPKDFPGACRVFPVRDTLFLGYQGRWLKDPAVRRLGEKPRQVGWTWATAYDTVRTLGQQVSRDNRWDAWITSRDAEQAMLTIRDMEDWATLLQIGAQDLGERVVDEKGTTTQQLRFANGLVAHSMSSNFNAQAGKRGHRILDEFALHEQQRQLFAIAEPGITWGGRLSIFSTHRGSATFFNQLVREAREGGNPKRFSLHRVTLEDALADGFLFKLQSKLPESHEVQGMDEAAYFDYKRAGAADEESFLQEYMCVPADDATAFLTYEQICACEYPPGEAWAWDLERMARSEDPLYVGVDIGRDHDLTVVWVLQRTGGLYLTRAVMEFKGVPFSAQEAEIYPILGLSRVVRVCIDQTGIGRQFAERAAERFGSGKVEGVTFTVAVKDEMATPLRGDFQDRLMRIPQSNAIRTDLRSIKRIAGAGDVVRYAADRGKNGHADRFWALALARRAGMLAAEAWGATVSPAAAGTGRMAGMYVRATPRGLVTVGRGRGGLLA